MKRLQCLLLASVMLLAGCGQSGNEDVVMGLRSDGGGVLVDDVFHYTVRFPEEWTFYSNEELQEQNTVLMQVAGEEPREGPAMPTGFARLTIPVERELAAGDGVNSSVQYDADVMIYCVKVKERFDAVVRKNYDLMLEAVDKGLVDSESAVEEPEAVTLDGVECFRLRIEQLDGENVFISRAYFIPLASDVVITYTMVGRQEDAALMDLFDEAMQTWRWTGGE